MEEEKKICDVPCKLPTMKLNGKVVRKSEVTRIAFLRTHGHSVSLFR